MYPREECAKDAEWIPRFHSFAPVKLVSGKPRGMEHTPAILKKKKKKMFKKYYKVYKDEQWNGIIKEVQVASVCCSSWRVQELFMCLLRILFSASSSFPSSIVLGFALNPHLFHCMLRSMWGASYVHLFTQSSPRDN